MLTGALVNQTFLPSVSKHGDNLIYDFLNELTWFAWVYNYIRVNNYFAP